MGTSRSVDLLRDAFERVAQAVPGLLTGLNTAQLAWYPGPFANSIGWLVWHMARVEDDHMAGIAESEQVWLTDLRDRITKEVELVGKQPRIVMDARVSAPVTAAVRLVSVVNDVTQHLGQVAYVRGLLNARS